MLVFLLFEHVFSSRCNGRAYCWGIGTNHQLGNGSSTNCDILDVGCGQGRDALFIARLGHQVTAIDQSPSGIRDLAADAAAEGLAINVIAADIREYSWGGEFDVIVVDRTLHMLTLKEATKVLRSLLKATRKRSHILIADERSDIPTFSSVFDDSRWNWSTTLAHKGFLFMARD